MMRAHAVPSGAAVATRKVTGSPRAPPPSARVSPPPPLSRPARARVVPPPPPLGVAAPSPGSAGPRIGDGNGKMWAILAAVALVVMPAVALGLALSRPEDSDSNAEA